MRLATVRTADGTRAARVEGDRLLLLAAPDVGALLAGGQGAEAAADGETFGELLSPTPPSPRSSRTPRRSSARAELPVPHPRDGR